MKPRKPCKSVLGYTIYDDGVHLECASHPEFDKILGFDATVDEAVEAWKDHLENAQQYATPEQSAPAEKEGQ